MSDAAARRVRLFLALMLGEELAAAAHAPAAALLDPGAWRLAPATGLHVTLAFLGDVPEVALSALVAAGGEAFAGARAPLLVLEGAGAFPRRGAERVLWLGAREEHAGAGVLADLARRARAAARRAGLVAEDPEPFRAHVTLARPRRPGARPPEDFYALRFAAPFRPRAVTLCESLAEAGARRYVPRATFALAE